MRAEVGRRAFVTSVATGLPLIAGGAALAQSGAGGAAKARPGVTRPDPMLDLTLRELGRIHRRARQRQHVSGEDARAAAAQLRMMTVYARQVDLDQPFKQALRTAVARRGADAVLLERPDRDRITADLKQRYDIDARGQWVDAPADYATRAAALERLQRDGVSAIFERVSALLEKTSLEIDKQGTDPLVLRRIQHGAWYQGFCNQLQVEITRLTVEAEIIYVASIFNPELLAAYYVVLAALFAQECTFLWNCSHWW